MKKWLPVLMALLGWAITSTTIAAGAERRLLYVATPGIRDYLEYGGHGLLVFDIDHGHKFVRRIPTGGVDDDGKPINVKGICASVKTKRIHISTIRSLMCLDMVTEQLLWEREYDKGCDRMALSPDGTIIYQPSLEKDQWYVREEGRAVGSEKLLEIDWDGNRPIRGESVWRRPCDRVRHSSGPSM